MNNFLLFLAGLLVLILGAAFAAPQFINWSEYRSVFEAEASRVLGHRIRVGGNVDLRLLPSPYVRFEKLRVADKTGTFRKPFFRADGFTMYLSVAPLLKGRFEANQVEVARPVLQLALDETGAGNWHGGGSESGGAAPGHAEGAFFVPSDVALNSVRISDGTLLIHGPGAKELYRLDSVEGELSAATIEGPFSFKGRARSGGFERDIRFSSRRPGSDGALPFQSTMRNLANGATYVLKGSAHGLGDRPKLTGELTATLPLALARGQKPRLSKDAEETAKTLSPGAAGAFEVRSKLVADAAGMTLSSLSLSFEQNGRPQLVSGQVTSKWQGDIETTAAFTALWLDLDRIAGSAEGDGPVGAMAGFIEKLDGLFIDSGRSSANLKIDQATLGGEIVSNILLDLAKTNDVLSVNQMRAELPGRSRIEAAGKIGGRGDKRTFDGYLSLHGGNLKQFLGWAMRGQPLPSLPRDGYFNIRSQLSAGPGWISLKDIAGDLAATKVTGLAQYKWRGRRSLLLDLETPRFDAQTALPADLHLAGILRRLIPGFGQPAVAVPAATEGGQDIRSLSGLDTVVRLRFGELIAAKASYQDVIAEIAYKDDVLDIAKLALVSGDDLAIDLSGAVLHASKNPSGVLRGQVKGRTPEAITALVRIFDIPATARPDAARALALSPLYLAGAMRLDTEGAVALTANGSAADSQVNLFARRDLRSDNWRTMPAEVDLAASNANGRALLTQLIPDSAGFASVSAAPGHFRFTAKGVADRGMLAQANVATKGLTGKFEGRVTIATGSGGPLPAGRIDVDASEAGPLFAVMGLNPALIDAGVPAKGTVQLAADKDGFVLSDINLDLGSRKLAGRASLIGPAGARRLDAELTTSNISVAALLRPALSDQPSSAAAIGSSQPPQAGDAAQIPAAAAAIWSDLPFSFASLNNIAGTIKLNTARLDLADGLWLSGATMDIGLSKDGIVVKSLAGEALGGRVTGAMQLESAAAGATIKSALRLEGAALERLFVRQPGRPSAALGSVAATLTFTGQALSPRGLVSAMRGSGLIQLGPGRLYRMAPLAVENAADAVLAQKPDDVTAALRREVLQGLGQGDLPLGPRQVRVAIVDGAMRLDPIAIDTPQGAVDGTMTVDLATMLLDSQWRVTPKAQRSTVTNRMMTALPPVTTTFVGPLGQVASLEPQVDAGALERELTVRKMERDVEQLERIRREDEERARHEAERLKAIELERQRQLAEAERLRQQQIQSQPPSLFGPGGFLNQQPSAPPPAAVGPPPGTPQDVTPPLAAPQPPAAAGQSTGAAGTTPMPSEPKAFVPKPKRAVKRPPKFDPFGQSQSGG